MIVFVHFRFDTVTVAREKFIFAKQLERFDAKSFPQNDFVIGLVHQSSRRANAASEISLARSPSR